MERIARASPLLKARIAGVFYLLTFVTGALTLSFGGGGRLVANLVATACYIAVTLLFYDLFKPVNGTVSLIAALFSLVGSAFGALGPYHVAPFDTINSLAIFGVYCLLIGYLIVRSTFLPQVLRVLVGLSGLGGLTCASPPLPYAVSP